MERLICNFAGKPRQVILNGAEYLVAPLTMIVEGVLNGSDGPLYYPAEELSKNPTVWNGVWMVLNHPKKDGKYISASEEGVIDEFGLGTVQNAVFVEDGAKLVAEGWFEVERVRRIRPSLLNQIRNGGKTELSTGLAAKKEKAKSGATFNGTPYTKIARDFRPDHLAILPDTTGACSLEDGCGVNNEASHEELRSLLVEALRSRFTQDQDWAWVYEVYDAYLIYEQSSKLWRLDYTKTDSGVSLSSESPVEVVREVTYVETANNEETSNMAKMTAEERKEVIDGLVANSCGCWKPGDEKLLNGFTDDKLKDLQVSAKEAHQQSELVANLEKGFAVGEQTFKLDKKSKKVIANSDPEEGEEDDAGDGDEPPTRTANAKKKDGEKKVSDQEWLENAPESVQNALGMASRIMKREKSRLITAIVANVEEDQKEIVRNKLAKKSLDDLELMASVLPKARREDGADFDDGEDVLNYLGRAGGVPSNVTKNRKPSSKFDKDDVLEPSLDIDWEELANVQRK